MRARYMRAMDIEITRARLNSLDWIECINWNFYYQIFTRAAPAMPSSFNCLSVCLCVCLCVCLSHAGIVSKRLNVGSRKRRYVMAQGLYFSDANGRYIGRTGRPCRWNLRSKEPTPFEHHNFDQYPLIAPQLWELAKKVQLALIGSRRSRISNEP